MKEPKFVHLHLHTEYSIVDGITRVKSLPEEVSKLDMSAVAITDHTNLFAMVKFFQAALQQGVKPIMGSEVWIKDQNRTFNLILLCKDEEGYRNISVLISKAYQEGQVQGRPFVQKSWIAQHAKGLIAISGGLTGEIAQVLQSKDPSLADKTVKEWMQIFPDNFYLSIQRVGTPQEEAYIQSAIKLSEKNQVPLVATNAVCFLKQADFDAHEARVCIHAGTTLIDENREKLHTQQQYLKSPQEMIELFSDIPEAIENTIEVSKRCNLELTFGIHYLPDFTVPEGTTLDEFFVQQAEAGLEKRFELWGDKTPEEEQIYQERLKVELDVIIKMRYPGYFLVVADFIVWAKSKDIPVGPGRGSGAGSLVAYVLGITDIDPIAYDLLFERFLNPERVSMPDFDIDFCMEGRDRVIEYVGQKYGNKNVSQIITYGTMAAKAVVRDVGRVLSHPYGFVDQLARLIPFKIGMTLKEALSCEELLLERYEKEEEVKNLIDLALKLEGVPRNAGKHAGGVVIAPKPLVEFMPMYCEAVQDGEETSGWLSQFDKDDVEKIGLVKFDFLGLRTLTIIHWAVQRINKRLSKEEKPLLDISQISLEDEKVFDLLKACQTTAVFQLESQGIKELIKKLQPDHFDEIVALVALYRPGPLQSGMVDDFIDRKHGRAKVKYLNPKLELILKSTYGVILYQEQVMQIAQNLAGYTLGGADLLRRAMGKKKAEEMAKQREIFVTGAEENNIKESVSNKIFDIMEKFAGYGFNKSHSVGYALLSYQTAWLKAHYPAEFMSAVLSSDMNNTEKVVHFLEDCEDLELTVLPPNVNESDYLFQVNEVGEKIYGLGAVKGVGDSAAEVFLLERKKNGPFTDLFEFCRRLEARKVNRKTLEALTYCGAFDVFGISREVLIASIDVALKAADQFLKNQSLGQSDLFSLGSSGVEEKPPEHEYITNVTDWTNEERLSKEKEALGFYLTGHPIETYSEELQCFAQPLNTLKPTKKGETVMVAGWVMSLKFKITQSGNRMAFVHLDDNTAKIDLIIFSDTLATYRHLLGKDKLLIFEGEVSEDDYTGGHRMIVRQVITFEQARKKFARQLSLKLNQQDMINQSIDQLKQILGPFTIGGKCPVKLDYENAGKTVGLMLGGEWDVNLEEDLIDQLSSYYGKEKIRVGY